MGEGGGWGEARWRIIFASFDVLVRVLVGGWTDARASARVCRRLVWDGGVGMKIMMGPYLSHSLPLSLSLSPPPFFSLVPPSIPPALRSHSIYHPPSSIPPFISPSLPPSLPLPPSFPLPLFPLRAMAARTSRTGRRPAVSSRRSRPTSARAKNGHWSRTRSEAHRPGAQSVESHLL